MADDFDFACPRCGKEPKRGKFLGSQIWHDECLVEDLIEKFKNGTPREEIEKTLKRVKDSSIEQKVGLECGWPEYQPKKTQEELEAEYEAELEAAEAKKAAEEAEEAAKKAAEEGDEEALEEAQKEAREASKKAEAAEQEASSVKTQIQETPKPTKTVKQKKPTAQKLDLSNQITTQTGNFQSQMPVMGQPMVPIRKTVEIRPPPTDPVVKNITISAMHVCLKQMKKDVAYGKLLFKMIKEFDWKKENEKEKSNESKQDDDDQGEKEKEEGQELDDDQLKPFLVEK